MHRCADSRARQPLVPTATSSPRAGSQRRELAGMLHRGDEGEGRFRPLVEVGTVGLQAVVATAGLRIPHRCRRRCFRGTTRRRVRSQRASHRRRSPLRRAPQASAMAATSIGCWSKPGARSPGRRRRRGWGKGGRRSSRGEEPAEHRQGVLDDVWSFQRGAGGEERVGQHGVGVRQARFGPRPAGVRSGRPMVATLSASSARARTWCGSTASTSAAPSAAKAIARGDGAARRGPGEVHCRAPAHPFLRARTAPPCRTPRRCVPSSPRRCGNQTSARRQRGGCVPGHYALGVGDESKRCDRGRSQHGPAEARAAL